MDSEEENSSCCLDVQQSTYLDLSKSDTLPSISIDGNTDNKYEHKYLKDFYDTIDKLRRENFDLKLMLHLYEQKENPNPEFRIKILNAFQRKDQEIVRLKEIINSYKKDNVQLRSKTSNGCHKLQASDIEEQQQQQLMVQNKELKTKLTEAVEICSQLVRHAEQLVNMNRVHLKEKVDLDKLNSSQVWIEKASRFVSDNNSVVCANNNQPEFTLMKNAMTNNMPATIIDENQINIVNKCSQPEKKEDDYARIVKNFMKLLTDLRDLNVCFRSNQLSYKEFSTKLEDLFDQLTKEQYKLEQLQQIMLDNDTRYATTKLNLREEIALKEKIKCKLTASMRCLDSMISKTKQAL